MREGRPALDRSASIGKRVFISILAFATVTAAVLVVLMMYLRTEAVASGQKVLAGFAELANEQTTRTLQSIEQTLQAATVILSAAAGTGTVDADVLRAQFQDLIKDRPFLRAIVVIDKQGRIAYGPIAADLAGKVAQDHDRAAKPVQQE